MRQEIDRQRSVIEQQTLKNVRLPIQVITLTDCDVVCLGDQRPFPRYSLQAIEMSRCLRGRWIAVSS